VLARRSGYNKSSWGRALMRAAHLPHDQGSLTEPTFTVALQPLDMPSPLLNDSDMTDLVLRQLSAAHMFCAALVCREFAAMAPTRHELWLHEHHNPDVICPTGWKAGSAEDRCKWALSLWPQELRVMLWLWHPAQAPAGENLQALDQGLIKDLGSGARTAGISPQLRDLLGSAPCDETKQRTVVSNWLRPAAAAQAANDSAARAAATSAAAESAAQAEIAAAQAANDVMLAATLAASGMSDVDIAVAMKELLSPENRSGNSKAVA